MIKDITDLGFVAALASKGYQGKMYTKGGQAFFTFEWDEVLDALETDYFNNQLDVDARTYNKNLRNIKRAIIEATRA